MLIFTGEYDFRIPYTQSLEAFTAARVRGIPARLVEFENEAHQVFKPQNSLVWNREFFGWLNKYVNNRPKGSILKAVRIVGRPLSFAKQTFSLFLKPFQPVRRPPNLPVHWKNPPVR